MNFNLKLIATGDTLVLICTVISQIDTGKGLQKITWNYSKSDFQISRVFLMEQGR